MDESVLYRLKNLNDHNVISIYKNQFKIGRATTNDLAIESNRYISSTHCVIEFDNGHVHIRDTSSNGTLINRSKKINKNTSPFELHTGDIVHLVFRKDEPGANVIFQLDLPPVTKLSNQTGQKLKRKHSDTPVTTPNDTKENADLSSVMNSSTDAEVKRMKPNEELAMKIGDDMEDVLTCVCCQDIMENPICLEPCLHAFCSNCYASWEAVQRTCPKCRAKVIGKKKNVVINGILEAYLKAYPHKRPALQSIDNTKPTGRIATNTKNEVGPDGMYINNNRHNHDDDDDEGDDDEEENDDNEDDDDDDDGRGMMDEDEDEEDDEDDEDDNDGNEHFVLMMSTSVPEVRFNCYQCPTTGFGNKPNTNIVRTNFQCRPNQKHILCQCCNKAMPDRLGELNNNQSCEVCHQHFCNMYYQQCQRQGCLGCLNQLRNFNFSPRHLVNLVNDNPTETQILQNYLTAHRVNMRDFLVACCQRLDRNEFTCSGIDRNTAVPSSKIVCYKCGLRMFKELAFQFRVTLKPKDILPTPMRNREDCYYGKNCRTQHTKPGHAQRFNHACEQKRH